MLIAALPSRIKVPLYRLVFGYRIGKGVRLGFGVVFLRVERCRIADHTRIGAFNLFYRVEEVAIGEEVRIGHGNLFRGGRRIDIGPYAKIMRLNVFNAIPEPDAVNEPTSVLSLGAGVVVTTAHWLDFTDRLSIGAHTVVGGRNSSFWTHNRQRTRAIRIGAHCYLGSEVRAAPGVELPPCCVVALGSVLTGQYSEPRSLVGGNPASVRRPLKEHDRFLVETGPSLEADTAEKRPHRRLAANPQD
jgi:acetyltransferase-like isoleucine patch superfamily enzyme